MANYTGAVRFKDDGSLLYFVYQGTTDIAFKQLYKTVAEADDARENANLFADIAATPPSDSMPVDVMPYYGHEDEDVIFLSMASRSQMLITGPCSHAEVDQEDWEPSLRT
jgi:hypothetical protein